MYNMADSLSLVADELSVDSLRERIGGHFEVDTGVRLDVILLDTFDWRLHDAGSRLTMERSKDRTTLHWYSPTNPGPYTMPVSRSIRFAHELGEGYLRQELEALVELRALLPLGAARVTRQIARIDDGDGNTVVQLVIETSTPLDDSNRPAASPRRSLTVRPVAAAPADLATLVHTLRESGVGDEDAPDVLAQSVAARGRHAGDYTSKPRLQLRPDQPAVEVMRAILNQLRHTVVLNVEGVLGDIDVEFLHDLRVACRRARTAIGQSKNVLPGAAVDKLGVEIKWICAVTGPCRDLDVFLSEITELGRDLGESSDDLESTRRLLRAERQRELRRVRRALRSARFDRLMGDWAALCEPTETSAADMVNASRPILEVASEQILDAYRRVRHRILQLGNEPKPEALHRVRIAAKKLRYALEFFACLFPEDTVARLVKELKRLQDALGGFNDMEIQQQRLMAYGERLMPEGTATIESVFAMGRLTAVMRQRQESYRQELSNRFGVFADERNSSMYEKTFGEG